MAFALRPSQTFALSGALTLTALVACSVGFDPDPIGGEQGGQAGAGGGTGGTGGTGGSSTGASGGTGGSGGSGGSSGSGGSGSTSGVGGSGGANGAGGTGGASGGGGGTPLSEYAELVLAQNPVAYYRFDDANSGPLASTAPGGPSGTVVGAPIDRVVGALVGDASSAARFTDSNVTLGDAFTFAPGSPFTFEVWVKPSAPLSTGFPKVFSKYVREQPDVAQYAGFYMLVRESGVTFAVEPLGSDEIFSASSGSAPSVTDFTYAVAVSDGKTYFELFINGVSAQRVDKPLTPINLGTSFLIGEGPDTERFHGTIDEFAVYTKVLTPDVIAAHYNVGHNGPTSARRGH
jgi:Concanavalin A-like lectin/glucanases superfamily